MRKPHEKYPVSCIILFKYNIFFIGNFSFQIFIIFLEQLLELDIFTQSNCL